MRGIQSVIMWLRALLRRDRVESEMAKEMRLHLEMEAEENVRRGMPPEEARRQALIAFGGVEAAKESVRDERRTRWLEDLASDVKYTLRGFRRQPGFTAAVVLLVGLGVGANAAIFSVVDHLMISPLPFKDGNRMVMFSNTGGGGQFLIGASRSDATTWAASAHAVESIVAYNSAEYILGDTAQQTEDALLGAQLPPGGLAFVAAHPALGRDILPSDTVREAALVALISHDLWTAKFASDSAVVGKPVVLSGKTHTIIGVLPEGFRLPFSDKTQIVTNFRSVDPTYPVDIMAKLRPGVSVEQANRELVSIFSHLDAKVGQDPPRAMRKVDWLPRSTKRILVLMFAAVCILLVVACANVANLLMTRAWSRQRELAVRVAMGAGRARLVRQMFTESGTLSLFGGVFAVGVALLARKLLVVAQPAGFTEFSDAPLDASVVGWGLALVVATGILFGLAPALFVAGHSAGEWLKAGARSNAGSRGARRFRATLVVAEVGLSAMLLVGSGLLVRSIVAMKRADTGVVTHGLWSVHVNLNSKQIGDSLARKALAADMMQRVRAVPGVQAATIGMALPPHFGGGLGQIEIEDRPVAPADSLRAVSISSGQPDLFAVAGIKILEGRSYGANPLPVEGSSDREIVVNQGFAKRFWPNESALGKRVRRGGGPWATIVGVAVDVGMPGADRSPLGRTQFYTASGAAPRQGTIIIRSNAPSTTLFPSVKAAIAAASPLIRIGTVTTADVMIAESRTAHRFTLTLIAAFAALSVVLAAFGLHAVVAYAVGQRTREIGVRVALGAESGDVARLVLGQGVKLALAGAIIGGIGGAIAGRAIQSMLYEVRPADPVTLVGVAAALFIVALVASYLPARRAMRIDPTEALRAE